VKSFIASVCCILSVSLLAQQWDWAKSVGGIKAVNGSAVSTDNKGHVLVAGDFASGTITFGSTTLTNSGFFDMYVAKYDGSGNVLWAKSSGGNAYDGAKAISADVNDNILLAGSFGSTIITFGSNILTNDTSDNSPDVFLVKYDSVGNVLWSKSAGGSSYDEATSVCTDPYGNIIVAGYFKSPVINFGDTILYKSGNIDVFIAKYNALGNFLWARRGGGSSNDMAPYVSSDADGNILMTGKFIGQISFDTITLQGGGMYVVKYDPGGNALWATNADGMSYATSVTTDNNNNILVTGVFVGGISFGALSLFGTGSSCAFIVKYDGSGNLIWAKSVIGNADNTAKSVATDMNNNVVVTGFFNGSSNFGPYNLISPYGSAIFLAKYDGMGNILYAKSVGGSYNDKANSVATDSNDNIFVVGTCYSLFVIFGDDTLYNSGYGNMIIAKLSDLTAMVNELSDECGFITYPNPSQGALTVDLKNKITETKIFISDVFGNCLWIKNYRDATSIKIDLSCQPKGIYFMEIISEGQRAVKKIVIQ